MSQNPQDPRGQNSWNGYQGGHGPDGSHWSADGSRPAPYQQGAGGHDQQNPYQVWASGGAGTGQQRQPRRFGAGTVVTGMVLAALVGGGVAAGAEQLHGSDAAGSGAGTVQTRIVNDHKDVNAVSAAAEKASPSVVTISVAGSSESGTGSGVLLDKQGHILTNTHVVTLDGAESSAKAQVKLSDGTVRSASVVGTDPNSDLAVIKIDPQGLDLVPASLGDSGKLNVGQTAVAIGSPLGLDGTVTDGIVSNLHRTIQVASSAAPKENDSENQDSQDSPFRFEFPDQDGGTSGGQSQGQTSSVALNVIQTDAAINPGNSGGPLLNDDGEVIGINVAIASAGSGSGSSESSSASGNIGVGFSIPIDYAKRISREIIDNGHASHGYLGASVSSTSSSQSGFSQGAKVADVVGGSPADRAGLKSGDVITKIGDTPVSDAEGLTASVRQSSPETRVTVSYQRHGSARTAEVTLGDAKDAEQ